MRCLRYALTAVILLMYLTSCKLNRYARAEKHLCQCLSGVRMPADEFCTKWNDRVVKQKDKVFRKLNHREVPYWVHWQFYKRYAAIKTERDSCMARISRFYGSR